jgi:protease-4
LSEKEYALALAADEIVMPKDAPFHFDGLAMDISHYPGLLEKPGIEVQYFRYGKYKSASGEQMGRKAFTEPVKEMLEENLERVYSHFVAAVAAFRKLEEAKVRGLIDESGFKSDWALERKLIDKLAYWDEVEDELRGRTNRKPGEKINWVSSSAYRKVSATSVGLPTPKHTFALIYSQGIIVAGKGGGSTPLGDGETQGTAPIIEALRRAVEDEKVKAIIFRVDSPGGAGLGCDYIRREIERARAKKPIIVSMSDVAASGGYWVSMDATAIVAQPSTATGSIGIYSVVPNLAGLYDKLALNNETFKRGAHADALIGARKLDEAEAKRFDDDLHASYLRFVELAAKGRSKPVGVMQELAQGRTWYGSSALENGLVDKLGGFPAAIALAKQKAGLAESDTVGLEVFHKRRGLLEQLLNADEDQEEEGSGIERSLLTRAVERLGLQPLLRRTPFLAPFAQAVLAGETTFPMMEQRVEFR